MLLQEKFSNYMLNLISCNSLANYESYPKLRHRHKNGCCSVETFVKFVWKTMGRKLLNGGRYRALTSRYGYKLAERIGI